MTTTETPAATETGIVTYQIDPAHSSVNFSVRHLMITHVRGAFSKISGTLQYNTAQPDASHVDVEIDANSLTTGQPDRDNHLKSAEFLDTATYPTIKFQSTSAQANADGTGSVTGDLTIQGVTKSVVLEIESVSPEVNDSWGSLRRGFSAETKIKRSEFGVTYNSPLEGGGVVIGEEIKITIDVQFVRQP
jgi:polyisoprenoid-binding protein YceI